MPVPLLSIEYIQSLGVCWTPAQLAEAAITWPSPTPSWAWFLGMRLEPMARSAAMLRVQVALAHVIMQRLTAPKPPRDVLAFCRTCTALQFVAFCEALGPWLDAPDEPTYAALAASLSV